VPPPEDIVQKQRSADGDEHTCKTEDMDGASWASSEESMAVGEAMLGDRDRRHLMTCVAACVEADKDKGRAERWGRRRACGGDEGQRARAFLAEVHAACRVGEEATVLTSGTELQTCVVAGAVRR
jgi:hypothetical protein